ncbi:4-alpha-glucanotransferase [Salinarimonas ramus]|uniref:4-alpha-glucanotransferase n=1 Tax=Salinarimonas ramus TaxID=690164 RepID=A0A917Q8C3_9HYPH|nr:4-alpha-glucanotransferase [Salinarimonas ramus]GGK31272.1 4-alpha-glucanotransferase [Salinarimonas ramus]
MADALHALAEEAGLHIRWEDFKGRPQEVSQETLRRVLAAMGLPADGESDVADSRARLREEAGSGLSFLTTEVGQSTLLPPAFVDHAVAVLRHEHGGRREMRLAPTAGGMALPPILEPGYHGLEIGDHHITLAVAPAHGVRIEDLARGRDVFGLAAQIYSLPPRDGEEFGDFGSLAAYAEAAGHAGADAVAMSPTHALFAADASRFSPYSPSTRLFHNVLYADPTPLFGPLDDLPAPEAPPRAELVDWSAGARIKLARLRALYERFEQAGDVRLRGDFAAFRAEGGSLLELHARYEALHARHGGGGFHDWPQAFRDPASPEVEAFCRENVREVAFHAFLQWLAERALADAQRRAKGAGMAIGLVADLAVGMDGGGSHVWSRREDVLDGLSIGAPPDLLGPTGQDWGLTNFSPRALQATGFAPFLATLRAALRCGGGVRIDHAMGLRRLWVVPEGMTPHDGCYISYPEEDMLRLVALESHRSGGLVIGEDLGTVPPGFRPKLDRAGVLGMRVLWFERGAHGAYTPPADYARHAASMTTTHDLPTVAGWWRGNDVDWRKRVGHGDADFHETQHAERETDRGKLWDAFVEAGTAEGAPPAMEDTDAVVDAALGFVAKTASNLAIVPAEDLHGLVEQPNLPGTLDEHPNWRRRLPPDALDDPAARRRMALLAKARPRGTE